MFTGAFYDILSAMLTSRSSTPKDADLVAGEVLAVEFKLEDAPPAPGDAPISIDGATVGLAVEKA